MTVSARITVKEWETRTPEKGTALEGLTLSGDRSVQALVQKLSTESILELAELRAGLRVRSFSFVGTIRIGNVEITIVPKIDHVTLLNLLRYAYGFRKLRLFAETPQRLMHAGFQDLLVAQLNAEVAELIARGAHRSYTPQREELESPRGRLDLQRFASGGGLVSSKLPCIHHPRIEDNLMNQVLLAGLQLAAQIASDVGLRRQSTRIAAALQDRVSQIRINDSVIGRAEQRLNRLTQAYDSSLTIIRLLIDSRGIALNDTGRSLPLPGFLFDMNRFFQALISRFLRDNLTQCIVRDEYRIRGMMRYTAGFNPRNRRSPDPRPDFVLQHGSDTMAILDAKYRDLWEHPLPRHMLYQLAIYAGSHRSRAATILYPSIDSVAAEARIDVVDPVFNRALAQVRLRPVDLQRLESLVLAKPSASGSRQKTAFAEWLALGQPT